MNMGRWLTKEEFSPLRGFSNWAARPFGKTPPNIVTLVRFLFPVIVGYVLFEQQYLLGIILGTVMFLSDFIDGALARYQARKYSLKKLPYDEEVQLGLSKRFFLLGRSHLGENLDATGDKFSVFIPLFVMGWGVVYTPLLILAIILAVVLILIRPIKRHLDIGINKSGKSNRFGKFKLHSQVVCLIVLNLSLWLQPDWASPLGNITLSLAILMAALSLFGHISTMKRHPSL